MFKKISIAFVFMITIVTAAFAWGSWGHQHINYVAIFGLPTEMRVFFYNHKDFIVEESVVPDLRKYTINDKAEFNRHFVDIEGFEEKSIDDIPMLTKDAYKKYDQKLLDKMGILPWYIQDMMEKLTTAMKNGRKSEILFIAADLGHYIGDANMPLHTSLNHNGQLTGQNGIHGLWESQLPDYFGSQYSFQIKEATYYPDVTKATWDMIKNTHSLVEKMLAVDKKLREEMPDKIFKKDDKGVAMKNKFGSQIFSYEYAEAFHKALDGMVEKQMNHAMQDLTNFWYTAWVNAGKPDLTKLDPQGITDRNKKNLKKDEKLMKKGKVLGFRVETEFDR